jgi:hypothetical protein
LRTSERFLSEDIVVATAHALTLLRSGRMAMACGKSTIRERAVRLDIAGGSSPDHTDGWGRPSVRDATRDVDQSMVGATVIEYAFKAIGINGIHCARRS